MSQDTSIPLPCARQERLSTEKVAALVAKYKNEALLKGTSHHFSASGRYTLNPNNVLIDRETAERAMEMLRHMDEKRARPKRL